MNNSVSSFHCIIAYIKKFFLLNIKFDMILNDDFIKFFKIMNLRETYFMIGQKCFQKFFSTLLEMKENNFHIEFSIPVPNIRIKILGSF
jgi:hypothetical protein